MSGRRDFLKTSLRNGLKVAGLVSLASLARVDRMQGQSQEDEDGYEFSTPEEEHSWDVANMGRPAPNWLRSAEVYNAWDAEWSEELVRTVLKDFPLIIGVPHVRKWMAEAHRFGIRVTPYIKYYKSFDRREASSASQLDFGVPSSPFWSELDLNKHPEWMLYDKQGKVRRPFSDPNCAVGWEQVCTAAPGFAQAALKGVQALLALGADGVFIDNVHPTPRCYGPAFGKHAHVNGLDNGEAFRKLVGATYALVKKASPDNIITLNGHAGHWPHADARMLESYICTTNDKT